MGKLLIPIVIGLFALVFRMYHLLDIGRTVYNHSPGVCRQVEGPVEGSEDIELMRSEGIAFVTSGVMYTDSNVEGKMFLYDFNQKTGTGKLKAKELPIKGVSFDKGKFHPHGLTHWVLNGVIRLYVINHDEDFNHSIEVFDYDPTAPALVYKKSLKNPAFIRPNGIVAVGPDQFIITNDGAAQSKPAIIFESICGFKAGSVYASHELLSGMAGPNGIAYDVKNNKLFINEANYKRMHMYDLAKDKKSVTLINTVNFYTGCDNLFLGSDGSLYSGCHPVAIELAKSLSDCKGDTTSPSQILRMKFDKEYKTVALSEPYANDGKEVSGSSVSVVYNNQMLIGTVCKGLLHCEIVHPSTL